VGLRTKSLMAHWAKGLLSEWLRSLPIASNRVRWTLNLFFEFQSVGQSAPLVRCLRQSGVAAQSIKVGDGKASFGKVHFDSDRLMPVLLSQEACSQVMCRGEGNPIRARRPLLRDHPLAATCDRHLAPTIRAGLVQWPLLALEGAADAFWCSIGPIEGLGAAKFDVRIGGDEVLSCFRMCRVSLRSSSQ